MRRSIPLTWLGWLALGFLVNVGLPSSVVNAQATCDRPPCGNPQVSETEARPRPAFFEESQPANRSEGFADSFLTDALDGVSDPLTGGGASGSQTEGQVNPASPRPRADVPTTPPMAPSPDPAPAPPVTPNPDLPADFDRTSVIIRRSRGGSRR